MEFLVRARAAPVKASQLLSSVGKGRGVEYLADIVRNALFVSKGHRENVSVTLVFERSSDFSRILRISGSDLGSFVDLHEKAILDYIAEALGLAEKFEKNEEIEEPGGVFVTAKSFEAYFDERKQSSIPYLLDQKGEDIRCTEVSLDSIFVMSDHTPMPKNSKKSLINSGIRRISVGPKMLHTSQCIAVVLNELDRRSDTST